MKRVILVVLVMALLISLSVAIPAMAQETVRVGSLQELQDAINDGVVVITVTKAS